MLSNTGLVGLKNLSLDVEELCHQYKINIKGKYLCKSLSVF
jgi:hypothetical protein